MSLILPSTYKKYNSDIECPPPSFGSPQSKSTPKSNFNFEKDLQIDLKVNKVLFHTEAEKTLMRKIQRLEHEVKLMKSPEVIKFDNEILLKDVTTMHELESEKSNEVSKIEDVTEEAVVLDIEDEKKDKKEIRMKHPAVYPYQLPSGEYWSRLETIAEIHEIPEDLKPTYFLNVPNNARQVGTSSKLQNILGHEIDKILSETPDEILSTNPSDINTVKKYVYIKPKNEQEDENALLEAIFYDGNQEVLI